MKLSGFRPRARVWCQPMFIFSFGAPRARVCLGFLVVFSVHRCRLGTISVRGCVHQVAALTFPLSLARGPKDKRHCKPRGNLFELLGLCSWLTHLQDIFEKRIIQLATTRNTMKLTQIASLLSVASVTLSPLVNGEIDRSRRALHRVLKPSFLHHSLQRRILACQHTIRRRAVGSWTAQRGCLWDGR